MDLVVILHAGSPFGSTGYTGETLSECSVVPAYPDVSPIIARMRGAPVMHDPAMPRFTSASQFRGYYQLQGIWSTANPLRAGIAAERLTVFSNKPLPQLRDYDYKVIIRGASSRAAFQASRKDGSIILNPLLKAEIKVRDAHTIVDYSSRQMGDPFLSWVMADAEPKKICTVSNPRAHETKTSGFTARLVRPVEEAQFARAMFITPAQYVNPTMSTQLTRYDFPGPQLVTMLRSLETPPGLVNSTLDAVNSGVMDVLTELGEMPETIGYIYDTLKRILNLYLDLRRGAVRARKAYSGKELIDEIASLWMQFRYAVSPMAYSVSDALDLIGLGERTYITERGRRDVPFDFSIGDFTFSGTAEHRCFAKARVLSDVSKIGVNPVKTLWELTPFSFVVDWVIPVGQLLGALVPNPGVDTKMSTSIRVRNIECEVDGEAMPVDIQFYENIVVPAKADLRLGFNVYLNWKRTLDGLALGWSMFLKQHWKS